MRESFSKSVEQIVKACHDMWLKGWTEANGGNVSVRLCPEAVRSEKTFRYDADWIGLDGEFKNVADECFLITGTGKYLRNVELAPRDNLGVIQLDEAGKRYRLLWGYENGGGPTSELLSHLQAHCIRKDVSGDTDRVFIHCHCPNVIALTHACDIDTAGLTKMLWGMNTECIVIFPEGIEFIPWKRAGSKELADATAKALKKRRVVLWQFHGISGVGASLDEAFGLIHVIEKAAYVYIKAASMGQVKNRMTAPQMLALAEIYDKKPDEEIFKTL